MRQLHPAHWALALLMAAALHLLLLAGIPRPAIVSGDSDGARAVTINLGSAVVWPPTSPSRPATASPAPTSGAERAPESEPEPEPEPESPSARQSPPSAEPVITQQNDEMKPAPETATEAEPKPPRNAERTTRPVQSSNGPTEEIDNSQPAERNTTASKNLSQTAEKEINSSSPSVGADQSAESPARQIASYFGELRQWLAEHRRYPRRARMRRLEGTAVLQIELTADGQVRTSRIASSSGHQQLDQAVRRMLSRAQPLPPPPPDLDVAGRILTVPVDFSLR